MATLTSPGVAVSVIDESFYTPAAPGTVPLIIVTSAQDKTNASGTGTAQGTTKANAGKVWTITSQRDLTDTFGTPRFITDANQNPAHGSELNEYGLQAAYSLLGVSSRAYVVRADIDLSTLSAATSVPTASPKSGTYWLDTGNTLFGIFEWDKTNKVFVNKTPIVIDDTNSSALTTNLFPKSSFGAIGSYCVVVTSNNQAPIYYKNAGGRWVLVGGNGEQVFGSSITGPTFVSNCWQTSFPVVTSTGFTSVSSGTTFSINSQSVTIGSDVSVEGVATTINSLLPQYGVGAKVNAVGKLELYSDSITVAVNGGNIVLAGPALASLGLTAGTYQNVKISVSPHTQIPQYGSEGRPAGSVWVKTTSPGKGANWVVKYYNGGTKTFGTVSAPVYATAEAAIKGLDSTGGTSLAVGTLFVESNYDHGNNTQAKPTQANFKIWRRTAVSPTTITGANSAFSITTPAHTGTYVYSFDITESIAGSSTMSPAKTITVAQVYSNPTSSTVTVVSGDDVATAINSAGLANVTATHNTDGTISIQHKLGGEIQLTDSSAHPVLTTLGFTGYNLTNKTGTVNLYAAGDYDSYTFRATNWKPLVFEAKTQTPTQLPDNGTLWYDARLEDIDIMYHNGTTWVGYKTAFPTSDPKGPQVTSIAPTTQSNGTDLVDGDIWVDVSNIEMYGQNIYVWNGLTLKWIKQDPTDQVTENGWLFDDARWSDNGVDGPDYVTTVAELLVSDYLDPDAPDPALYPRGTRLWNLRRSGFSIKRFEVGYVNIQADNGQNIRFGNEPMNGAQSTTPYNTTRWVTVSPNQSSGAGTFGRQAQRSFVVSQLKALINTNPTIRDTDTLIFNLIACPGYTEVISNLVSLNTDRGTTAFVIGDTPMRLKPNGTDLTAWGKNTAGATDNGETGAVTYDDYMGMFYPSGFTSDNLGNNIVVPASHMMLRTIALSDQIAYPWFAPAGIRRGLVDNATSVGYLDNGEFKTTALPQNLRDVLYGVKVNPIATLNGVGVTNFGNLTRAPTASALDRINVARLVAYLRRQLDVLSRPYIFEPNDSNTRNEIKSSAESLLLELVGLRAVYDFIVVCDESNNTAARIDRNELWMDIAIEPVKSVEFIYIPLRLKSTGSIATGNI